MTLRILTIAALALAAPILTGCGFTPLYAVDNPSARPVLSQINLAGVDAADTVAPVLARAFEARTARAGDLALYDLTVATRETANALVVQIDASVTRYNYRLTADYVLSRRSDGKEIKGRAEAISSFNVVDSQYSTLFAEEAAREKAARVLVDEVERSILLKMEEAQETQALASRKK
ncbi:MAG: hypothetical protein VX640_01605 [Pseudomonadota bacterium]|nr:hypothetical protein [Pseudomonadota bacterium]